MDNQPAPQPAFVNPPPAPAWIKNVADSVAAVNTNGSGQWWTMNGQPAQQPSFAKTAPQPVIAVGQALAPVQPKWLNPYKGEPVNDSYSDTLRSMTPETNTTPVSQPTPVTAPVVVPPPTGYTPPAWYSYKPRGFGSSYGGNWGSGGGYSSGYSPYYSNQMGLYNWQFGG